MRQKQGNQGGWVRWLMAGGVLAQLLLGLLPDRVLAQITPDETLGGERSTVTPNVQVRGDNADRIDGGARRGANLFHSFQEFNVNDGQRVYFANPAGVENILGRVTGTDPSDIMGTLGVDGGANLFLLNPNGILFGPNAQLAVSGSFFATTADRFTFPDSGEFSAINPQAPSLLTVSAPIGVQFGGTPGEIAVEGAFLEIDSGRTFALVGGDVQIAETDLWIPGGQIELGAVANGTVGLNLEGGLLNLSFPQDTEKGSVSITTDISLDTVAIEGTSGNITINTGSLTIANSDLTSEGFGEDAPGDIIINARDAVAFDNAFITSGSDSGRGGDIEIAAGSLSLILSGISSESFEESNSGNILINVRDFIIFDNAFITSGSDSGRGGDIEVAAGSLSANGANIQTSAFFDGGSSGDISIRVLDTVELDNSSILTNVRDIIGSGGNIEIVTGSLSVINGTELNTSTQGQGNAGNIIINARDAVEFNNVRAFSSVGQNAVGDGGNIEITAGSLSLTNFSAPPESAALQTSSDGQGNAGNVVINARDSVVINDVNIFSTVGETGTGNGGNIEINTGSLSVTDSGLITGTDGVGGAGDVIVNARDSIFLSGGGTYSNTGSNRLNAEGDVVSHGGNVEITTGSLSLTNGAQLYASTEGLGDAGNVTITASDRVLVEGIGQTEIRSSSIFSSAELNSTGRSGSVKITTPSFVVSDGGVVNARTQNSQLGGDIIINADTVEAINGGQIITTTSSSGQAGNITLNVSDSITLIGVDPEYTEERRNQPLRIDTQGSASGLYANAIQGSTGQGGSIRIITEQLNVQDQAQIAVNSQSSGRAGNLFINADSVVLDNQAGLTAATLSSGGGNINLQISESLRLDNSSEISASTQTGQGGSINLNADRTPTNSVELAGNSTISAQADSFGDAGDVELNARELTVRGGSDISASTTSGQGGDITLQGLDTLQVNDSEISASTQTGQAGSLTIDTVESIRLNDGTLSVQAEDGGIAGNLTLSTRELSLGDGSEVTVSSTGSGRSGAIEITAQDAQLHGDSEISASTENGSGGSLSISDGDEATRSIEVRGGSRIATEATGIGDAGNLTLNAQQLTIRGENSSISASTRSGIGGDVLIDAEQITVANGGSISASARSGRGGDIRLRDLDSLQVRNGEISASTETGRAGSLTVDASESVNLSHSGRLSVEANGDRGRAGNLRVSTRNLTLDSGAQITARNRSAQQLNGEGLGNIILNGLDLLRVNNGLIEASTGTGQAGSITVNAQGGEVALSGTLPDRDQGGLSVRARNDGGNAGELTVRTRQLTIEEGAQITGSVTTGQAGDVTIDAADSVQLSGRDTRLSVEATGSHGRAGNLNITTDQLDIEDGAAATVSSEQGRAGNLSVSADFINLDHGTLQAVAGETIAGEEGGNIDLQNLEALVMRHGSLISAEALGGARGGNININTETGNDANGFIVTAPGENNDIVANANQGQGGEINITTQGIFGFEEGESDPPNLTNDINASSQFGAQGTVTIERPDTDPSRGLTELPTDVVDASNQISQVCSTGAAAAREQSEFIITGRGGLPLNPESLLGGEGLLADWVTLNEQETTASISASEITSESETTSKPSTEAPLVEAQGWVRGAHGEVIFVAQPPTASSQTTDLTPTHCQ